MSQYYAPLYWRTRGEGLQPSLVQLTVDEAVRRYIKALSEERIDGGEGAGGVQESDEDVRVLRKHKSRVSKLRVHVVPKMKHMILSTLRQDHVTEALSGMLVTKRGVKTPGMHSTRRETLKALVAVWNFIFPNERAPFGEAFLKKSPPKRRKRRMVSANDLPAFDADLANIMKEGVMSPAEVEQSLVGAQHSDRERLKLRHLSEYIPNTAHIIAILVGLGLRVSELVMLRWWDINIEEGFIKVPQSKIVYDADGEPNKDEYRIVPLQHALVPWLLDLMRLYGIADHRNCTSFVVQLKRKNIHSLKQVGEDSVIRRASDALKYSGTKPIGKATHFGRATHTSFATVAPLLTTHLIKAFVGHSVFLSSVSDGYFLFRREHVRPEHRKYVTFLSPRAVQRKLKGFRRREVAGGESVD